MALLTAGGRWAAQLDSFVRRNLRWFWLDGLFASASDSIIVSFLSLFALALGASRAQIGLMDALASLSAAAALFPGAALVDRLGQRKRIVLWSGGGIARTAVLLMALVPLIFAGPAAVYAVIALAVIRAAFGNLALPAWVSLTADIVPLAWRGRYFASRNIAMEVAKIAITLLVGVVISLAGGAGAPAGYQWALGMAFVIGVASTYSFARIEDVADPGPRRRSPQKERLPAVHRLRAQTLFVAFCLLAALWNFSLNIAGPFFNVYLVEKLGASAAVVGILATVASFTALPGQRLFGVLADRWGPRRVQLLTGLIIPVMPFAWLFVRSPWHVVPINLLGGFLWAGYNLASFNLLLELTPEDRRARYSALYQVVLTLSLAGGAALGGVIAQRWGYPPIFVFSGLGRFMAALLFARFVRQPTTG